jgi:hypothetical protein
MDIVATSECVVIVDLLHFHDLHEGKDLYDKIIARLK